ncbi:MAG: PIN domain-containing protein [Rhizobacter sp.]|nr:PIN domain-containing protein [Burkholderiales bacterium]
MPNATLVDAGPLIALLNPRDQDHARCVAFLQSYTGSLITTWPVITEASHLLSPSINAQIALLKWIERGALEVRHIDAQAVQRIIIYTEKYRDRPMDLADASLVTLAIETRVTDIISIDSDFDIYRLPNKRKLNNLLS